MYVSYWSWYIMQFVNFFISNAQYLYVIFLYFEYWMKLDVTVIWLHIWLLFWYTYIAYGYYDSNMEVLLWIHTIRPFYFNRIRDLSWPKKCFIYILHTLYKSVSIVRKVELSICLLFDFSFPYFCHLYNYYFNM